MISRRKLFRYFSLKTRNAYRILAGKPEKRRPPGRRRRRWVDNIKIDLGYDGMV
jgi:hypothetical protein